MFIKKPSMLDNDLMYAHKMQLRRAICLMHFWFQTKTDNTNKTHIMS